jgi:hypothetical protein
MSTETKALTAYRWNGEHWYQDEGMARRVLHWFAWFGGWQAHSPRRPWSLKARPLRERLTLRFLTPISFLGHRITLYSWGWEVQLRGTKLVNSKGRIYISSDGTPGSATVWFRGVPPEVRASAEKFAQERLVAMKAVTPSA